MNTPKNIESVGIGTFVKRQVKGSGKTYSTLTFEKIAKHAEQRLLNKKFKQGYRKGVILVSVEKELLKNFICPIVKIDENTKLESVPKKRRNKQCQNNYLKISKILIILSRSLKMIDVLIDLNIENY